VSSRGQAVILGIGAAALLTLAVFLAIQARTRPVVADAPRPPAPIAAAPAPPVPSPHPAAAPPRRPDAAPEMVVPQPSAGSEKLARGELPFPPPPFEDARDRDRFKRWWVTEMIRRADVYRRLEPDRRYPSDQETERMMERLYDLAEPARAGTPADQLADRQVELLKLMHKDFAQAFGTSPFNIIHRGADPQWGTAPDPPVLPPNWQSP